MRRRPAAAPPSRRWWWPSEPHAAPWGRCQRPMTEVSAITDKGGPKNSTFLRAGARSQRGTRHARSSLNTSVPVGARVGLSIEPDGVLGPHDSCGAWDDLHVDMRDAGTDHGARNGAAMSRKTLRMRSLVTLVLMGASLVGGAATASVP